MSPRPRPAADPRAARRGAIVALLRRERVGSQEALRALLEAEGFEVTQPSLSRDLRDLGVAKVAGHYVLADEVGPEARDALADVAAFVRDVRSAGPYLLVLQTTVGAAQTVAIALDRAGFPDLVGTVAGDDTIFAAAGSAVGGRRLLERLRRAFAPRRAA